MLISIFTNTNISSAWRSRETSQPPQSILYCIHCCTGKGSCKILSAAQSPFNSFLPLCVIFSPGKNKKDNCILVLLRHPPERPHTENPPKQHLSTVKQSGLKGKLLLRHHLHKTTDSAGRTQHTRTQSPGRAGTRQGLCRNQLHVNTVKGDWELGCDFFSKN